jgi:hypothetical protein
LPVVALGPVQVAGAVAGVVQRGCEACVASEVVGRGKPGQRAADNGQEFCAEHVTDPGQAGDDGGVGLVWKKAAASRSMTASCRSSSRMVWASRAMTEAAAASPKTSTVCRPAACGGCGKPGSAADSALLQPRASRAWPSRRIAVGVWKAANQDQRALVGEVQNSFQGRKDADEEAAEPVDAAGRRPDRRGRRSAAAQCHRQAAVAGADRVGSGLGRR